MDVSMTKRIVYKTADGATHEQAADMMLPATDRTISRIVDAWHDLKVGYLGICRGWARFRSFYKLFQTPAN